MNKKLLSTILAAAAIAAGTCVFAVPCKGPCEVPPPPPAEGKPCPPPECGKPPMDKEVCEKAKAERKAEFEKRLNLTEEQKAQLEKIKADEKKALEPVHKKMDKLHKEMSSLLKKEREVRAESMKKFEAVLTEEQKAELEKMKSEFHEKIRKDFAKRGPHPMMKPECAPGCAGPDCKKPDCGCKCHKKPCKK